VGKPARMFERSAPASALNNGRLYVGVDIGKSWLDASAPGLSMRVPNARKGYEELVAAAHRIRRYVQFVCEPTGSTADAFFRYLRAKRCKLSVISGNQVRQFALATRRMAKTDKIDSQVLADFGRTFKLPPTETHDPTLRRLRTILRRRDQILLMLVTQRQQRLNFSDRALQTTSAAVERALSAERGACMTLAEDLVARQPRVSAIINALCTVKGVGWLTAAIVLGELPEIGRLNRRQVAALAGIAPYNRDSGGTERPRHIHGGRARLRRALYLAAMVAQRFNPILAPFYRRLIARGKPCRVARIAMARKLLVCLNGLVRRTMTQWEGASVAQELHTCSPITIRRAKRRTSAGLK
jgi:transposase